MNNKSQLGDTITWMAGFLIIFFAVILFIIFTLILSGSKFIEGKDKIILDKNNVNMNSQEILLDILNDKMENGELVKEFIVKSSENPNLIKDALKEKFDEKLRRLGDCDYLFSAEYNPDNLKEYKKGKADLLYKKIDFGNADYADKEGAMLSLFSKEARIKVKFYFGECKYEHNEK